MNAEELNELTKGNRQAQDFIVSYVAFCHMIDDLVDNDKEVTDKQIVTTMLLFLEQIIMNPWVAANIHQLWPLIIASANSWLDANRWENSQNRNHQLSSDVLKGQYHEVIWYVAFLCGGFKHQQDITTKFRDFDYDHQ